MLKFPLVTCIFHEKTLPKSPKKYPQKPPFFAIFSIFKKTQKYTPLFSKNQEIHFSSIQTRFDS